MNSNDEANGTRTTDKNAQPPKPALRSNTPENKDGAVNPSAPGETGTTPGSNAK